MEKLNLRGQLGYACGMLGYSILINSISVMIVYFYLPPSNSGLTQLIPQIAVFGILSVLSLILASGRLLDAVTDPFIAYLSDKSTHQGGRRLPFMKWAVVPSVILCVLIFVPIVQGVNSANFWSLAFILGGFYLALTIYIVPFNALLPELAKSHEDKIFLAALLSVSFVLGIIVSSQIPFIADKFQELAGIESRTRAIQLSVMSLAMFACLFLVMPFFSIDEKKHCISKPATIRLSTSLRQTLSNKYFVYFVLAETLYFFTLTLVVSGMMYFLTVLLFLEEAIGGSVMSVMVLLSLVFYPLVVRLTKRIGKKKILRFSLIYMSLLTLGIFFMGKYPFGPRTQIFGFAALASFPLASLGILPYAIIAELAEQDSLETGQKKEGMYFAVRNLAIKIGQTLGIMTFAILTLFGKDPGHDFGIRLAGLVGFIVCVLAWLALGQYKELKH